MLWQLAAHGHALFPDNHADLTLEILDAARAAFGRAGFDRLVAARAAAQLARYRAALAQATSVRQRVAALARLRRQEGYMAEWRASGAGFVLVENHCPICAAARACQGLCAQELELFRAVLGGGVEVERTEHLFDGARRCVYAIRPRD
jgi:predicted ArsR family transcriptional regulator